MSNLLVTHNTPHLKGVGSITSSKSNNLVTRKDEMEKQELEKVIEELHTINQALKMTYERKSFLESVIIKEMQDGNATRFDGSEFVTDLKATREYDPNRFRSLFGEIMDKNQIETYITPEHTVEKTVHEKVNGHKVKSLWRQGSDITDKLEKCLVPKIPRIEIKQKPKSESPM